MKITNIVGAFIGVIMMLLTSGIFAGEHPSRLPQIQSQDRLRNYALSIATQGGRYVYSSSMDWNYTNTVNSASTNGSSGEDILNKVFSVPFRYRIINPNDPVNSTAYLYDPNWNLLFYGYGTVIAKDLSPTNGIHTSLWMQNIPILSDVADAQVLVLNRDGQTADTLPVQVNQYGQVMWQSWLSGYSNAMLSVTYTDGTIYTYNLAMPIANTPDTIYGSDDYSIDGHYQIVSSGRVATLKIMETWILPTAFLDLTSKQYIVFDVFGLIQDGGKPYFERPVSVEVTDDAGNVTTAQLDANKPTQVTFSSGKYRVRFNWTKFGQPGFIYTAGGGKG